MANITCYGQNGATTDDIPCGFVDNNQCCGSGWDCLANGLCRQHGTTSYAQAACTDIDYNNCLSFCNKAEFDGFGEVSSCGINSWCCAGAQGQGEGGVDCCDQANLTTSLQPFPYSTIAADEVGKTSVTPSTTSASATSQAHSLSSATKSSSRSSTSVGGLAQSTTSNTPSSLPSSSSSKDSGLSTGAKVGIGIAVPLGLLILAALAFFVYKSRKQGKYLKDLQRNETPGSHGAEASMSQTRDLSYLSEAEARAFHEVPEQGGGRYELGGDGRHEIADEDIMRHELSPNGRRKG